MVIITRSKSRSRSRTTRTTRRNKTIKSRNTGAAAASINAKTKPTTFRTKPNLNTTFLKRIQNVGKKSMDDPTVECAVYHLRCNQPKDYEKITHLSSIAKRQKVYFTQIYPWENKCRENMDAFVAIRPSPTNPRICAWATIRHETTANGSKAIYLIEVAARRKADGSPDDEYRGMGIELMKHIFDYANAGGIQMVYLVPLNAVVRTLYAKSLNMTDVPNTSYMTSVFGAYPLHAAISELQHKKSVETKREQKEVAALLEEMPANIRRLIQTSGAMDRLSLDDLTSLVGEMAMLMEQDGKVSYTDAKEMVANYLGE